MAIECSKDDRRQRRQALPKVANSLTDASQSVAAQGSCCIREGRFEFAPFSWISVNHMAFLVAYGF